MRLLRAYFGKLMDSIERLCDEEIEADSSHDEWSQYPYYIAFDIRDVELVLDMTGNLDSEM